MRRRIDRIAFIVVRRGSSGNFVAQHKEGPGHGPSPEARRDESGCEVDPGAAAIAVAIVVARRRGAGGGRRWWGGRAAGGLGSVMAVVVAAGLLDLGEGLLGAAEIIVVEGGGQSCERILRGAPRVSCGGALGSIGLKGGESRFGAVEITALQGLAKLVEEVLSLSPLVLLGGADTGSDTHV
jgi:hypothetical protein